MCVRRTLTVEQRRVMMQDWANRLDLLERGEVEAASRHLIVHLQGVAETAWRGDRTSQRLGVYASSPMDACWQKAMQDPTESIDARISMHTGSDITWPCPVPPDSRFNFSSHCLELHGADVAQR